MARENANQAVKSDTKELVLDAAERLFAREGFHNTSLRAITGEAGVNLAAVNYHFGSKMALLEAVFDRRLIPLNAVRRERLEQVREIAREEGHPPRVDEIFRAVIEPTLAFHGSGPGTEHFVTLVGRAMSEPGDTVNEIFVRHMQPLFKLAFELVREALPALTPQDLFWRMQFSIGCISHIMRMYGKFRLVPPGVVPEADTESLTEMMVRYITAGMETRP